MINSTGSWVSSGDQSEKACESWWDQSWEGLGRHQACSCWTSWGQGMSEHPLRGLWSELPVTERPLPLNSKAYHSWRRGKSSWGRKTGFTSFLIGHGVVAKVLPSGRWWKTSIIAEWSAILMYILFPLIQERCSKEWVLLYPSLSLKINQKLVLCS